MANRVGKDITGKVVVMQGDGPEAKRTVKVEEGTSGGFGRLAGSMGSALFVKMWNGKETVGATFRVSAYEVERVVE